MDPNYFRCAKQKRELKKREDRVFDFVNFFHDSELL